jgi:hypothetical protein
MRNKTKRVIRKQPKNKHNKRKTRRCKNKNTLIWGGENPTVEFADPSIYNVEKVGHNNDKDIYQFETENCMKYFYVKPTDEYIVYDNRRKKEIIIVKITQTNETNDKIVEEYFNSYIHSRKNILSSVQPKNIVLIYDNNSKCKTELNLDSCGAILKDWNGKLKSQYDKTMRLEFDYMYKLTGIMSANDSANILLLCLYKENSCISSIEIQLNTKINEINVSVNSKTNKKYEGKKYNLFLRCMAVILCYNLQHNNQDKKILKLKSIAVNPISAYIFIKYFNGEIIDYDNKDIMDKRKINNINNIENKDEITFQQIDELFGASGSFIVVILVDENNVEKAIKKANELLVEKANKTLKCE